MTSMVCPRLSLLKSPRSLKPFCELSTIRQGNLSGCPLVLATMLARLLLTTRSERRLSGPRPVGTAFAPVSDIPGLSAILPEDITTNNTRIYLQLHLRLPLVHGGVPACSGWFGSRSCNASRLALPASMWCSSMRRGRAATNANRTAQRRNPTRRNRADGTDGR